MTTTASFGQIHFGAAPLGHKARTACLVKIADRLHRHPGGTLPEKLHLPKDYKAMARLMNRSEVTHTSVLAAPCELTRQRMREMTGVVLVLHDTTELGSSLEINYQDTSLKRKRRRTGRPSLALQACVLMLVDYFQAAALDFSGLRSITDLGSIGGGLNRGLLCHNSLAFDPQQKEVLGLAHQILHRRQCQRKAKGQQKKQEGVKQKRERLDRESRLWVQGAAAVGLAPAERGWVHVADRGADTFEFLAHLEQQPQPQGFVVRACSNRVIVQGHDADGVRADLKSYARSLEPQGYRDVAVAAKPGQAARTARASVRFAPIQVLPPHVRRGEYEKKPLRLWVVCVREDQPPPGVEPLEWLLLTNVPVTTVADAWERVDWYSCRWVLEEYHKAQKTGCGIEQLQFSSAQALEPMIALLSVVAVTLLKLRDAARRPDAKERRADDVVDARYVEVLSSWRLGKPKPDWSIHEFFMALARLGGHQNRKRDHRPGWIVLWKGWMALQQMVDGAESVSGQNRG